MLSAAFGVENRASVDTEINVLTAQIRHKNNYTHPFRVVHHTLAW